MEGILLVSKKTYSILKKKPIVEWKTSNFSLDGIDAPRNFEIRIVEAASAGVSLSSEFTELELDWSNKDKIMHSARELFEEKHGLTDIAWFIGSLNIAIMVKSHCSMPRLIEVDSVDTLKKRLTNYAV